MAYYKLVKTGINALKYAKVVINIMYDITVSQPLLILTETYFSSQSSSYLHTNFLASNNNF